MQTSFLSLATHRQKPRSERFLDEMDKVVPWKELCALIAPHYKPGATGRKPYPLETMLRVHFLQQWYDLSDPAAEQEIADRLSFQRFVRLDPLCGSLADETTILNFRRLIEEHGLAPALFGRVQALLEEKGLMMKEGTIVDATLVAGPSSTKNKAKARDPEMGSAKKGQSWHFGLKAHIGADARSGLVHSVETTSASVHDRNVFARLLHGREQAVFGDKGYYSEADKRQARRRGVFWGVNDKAQRGYKGKLSRRQKQRNRQKSGVRAKVEFPFRVLKRQFHFLKTRYRGLAKNASKILTLFALVNLYLARRKILSTA